MQLQQGAQVFDYRYDPSDYRIGINAGIATRDFYLEGEHLEAVYGPGGLLTDKYLRGVVIDEVINGYHYDWPNKEKNLTFHHDHLNSVTAVTGHDGTTVETASYGPFGAMTSETGPALSGGEVANKLRYTGREFDRETGLYYYRARYYDPEIGRFYTEDPLRFRAGINFYAYVNNNPLNSNDPMGLFFEGIGEFFDSILEGNAQVAKMMEDEWEFDHYAEEHPDYYSGSASPQERYEFMMAQQNNLQKPNIAHRGKFENVGYQADKYFDEGIKISYSGTIFFWNTEKEVGKQESFRDTTNIGLSVGFGLQIQLFPPKQSELIGSPYLGFGRDLSLGTNFVRNPESSIVKGFQGININLGPSFGIPLGFTVPRDPLHRSKEFQKNFRTNG